MRHASPLQLYPFHQHLCAMFGPFGNPAGTIFSADLRQYDQQQYQCQRIPYLPELPGVLQALKMRVQAPYIKHHPGFCGMVFVWSTQSITEEGLFCHLIPAL